MENKVLQRLEKIFLNYQEVTNQLLDANVLKDVNKFKTLSKHKSQLEPIAKAYSHYKNIEQEIAELLELEKTDKELWVLAEHDLTLLKAQRIAVIQKLKLLLIPKDANDSKNVICEIKGAAGGDEANIFAGDLFRMYSKYCELKNWKITILETKSSESGGFSNLTFKIKGKNVYSKLKFEAGTHRVQRVPKTESKGRVHTSTATVAILPEVDEVVVDINTKDLRIDTYRSSGAGGQHVNTTDSAIRITHIPTGIVVTSQDGRSQHDNKALALEHLRSKLYKHNRDQQQANISSIRREAVGTGDRSEKIRTYNYPQNRVTDHRLQRSWNKLNLIIEGQLEEIITALIINEQQRKMEAFSDND